MRLAKLRVAGYRSLVDTVMPLRPLTVMIGPNGSGKTAVLEIVMLLRGAMQEKLSQSLEALGGLNAVLSRVAPPAEKLAIELELDTESVESSQPMRYAVELLPTTVGYSIRTELLDWGKDQNGRAPSYVHLMDGRIYFREPRTVSEPRSSEIDRAELALAQVPRHYVEPEALRSMLAKASFYGFLDIGHRAVVRLPQALTPASRPGANGENLFSALYNLRTNHGGAYQRILDTLEVAFPGFQSLEFPVVGSGQVTLAWYETALSAPLYPSELSEGTLRFLWLVAVLLTPDPAPLTLIDEPEVSLHPELLRLLAGLLQDAALRSTVIVATHATDLIRWLQPNEVAVLDKEEGKTRFTWADQMNLEEWLKEYSLGDLWLMGTLGGR